MDQILEEIVKACIEDKRLLEIIKNIERMTDEERRDFEQKLSLYFMNLSSEEDVQSYRFFKYVLENDNAKRILEEVEKRERSKE